MLCYEPHPDTFMKKSNLFQKILAYAYNWLLYLFTVGCVIDALSVFPLYAQYVNRGENVVDLRFFNVLRVFRMFRFFRLPFLAPITATLKRSVGKCLQALVVLFIYMTLGSIFFGTLLYYCEMGVWMYTTSTDPPSFTYVRKTFDGSLEPTPYTSIMDSCWWFVVTTTTVGYGDMYPTSLYGRVVSLFVMLTGLFVLAIPLSSFSGTWSEESVKNAEGSSSEDHTANESNDSTLTDAKQYEDNVKNGDTSERSPERNVGSNDISHDLSTNGRTQSRVTSEVHLQPLNYDFGDMPNHLFIIGGEQITENKDNISRNERLQSQNFKSDFDSISHHLAIIRKARKDIDRAKRDISKAQETIERTKKAVSDSEKEIRYVLRRRDNQIVGRNEQTNMKMTVYDISCYDGPTFV